MRFIKHQFLITIRIFLTQTDVIQDQYSIMIHRIQELDNFEDVQKVHQKFVNVVVELCFIKVAPLTECIMSMMNCCEAFCAIVGTDQSDQFDSIRQVNERHSWNLLSLTD